MYLPEKHLCHPFQTTDEQLCRLNWYNICQPRSDNTIYCAVSGVGWSCFMDCELFACICIVSSLFSLYVVLRLIPGQESLMGGLGLTQKHCLIPLTSHMRSGIWSTQPENAEIFPELLYCQSNRAKYLEYRNCFSKVKTFISVSFVCSGIIRVSIRIQLKALCVESLFTC